MDSEKVPRLEEIRIAKETCVERGGVDSCRMGHRRDDPMAFEDVQA